MLLPAVLLLLLLPLPPAPPLALRPTLLLLPPAKLWRKERLEYPLPRPYPRLLLHRLRLRLLLPLRRRLR
ncbi:unnamed protein product [Closterium sp. NIES-64]|nr:unnamed protein product [Closterium sp. NIES-64]